MVKRLHGMRAVQKRQNKTIGAIKKRGFIDFGMEMVE